MAWLDGSGYLRCWHKGKKMYVARVVLEEKLGRPLAPNEQAHHIDGDRFNNHPSNVELALHGPHQSNHNRRRAARDTATGKWRKRKVAR